MSSEIAVRLDRAGKCFQTYARPFHRLVQALYRGKKALYEEFWALRDVSLQVRKGETLGIIGRNGCGKSTLLQLVAGTLTPNRGHVESDGRISAILELGAGFNPDFTGIENARLNASILGMSSREIEERMPDIVDFSGLEEFVHRPVKTYSSGMYIRLAFSISINMDPEILIIDEALAVGDAQFQRKCFRKIEQLRNQGTTILFVTHATDSVISLCDRALLLDQGLAKAIGDPKHVVNEYLESLFMRANTPTPGERVSQAGIDGAVTRTRELNCDPEVDGCRQRITYNTGEYRWGDRTAKIIDYLLTDVDGKELGSGCDEWQSLKLKVAVYFAVDVTDLVYGFTIKTIDGAIVFGTNSTLKALQVKDRNAGEVAIVEFAFDAQLVAADYFVSIGVVQSVDSGENVLDRRYDLFLLKVNEEHRSSFGIAGLRVSIDESVAGKQ